MTVIERRRPARTITHLRPFLIGCVLGLDSISYHIAMAALIFSGPLSAYLGLGSGLFLLAAAFSTLMLVWHSALPSAVSNVQDAALAVLAPAVAIAALSAGPGEAALGTALAVLGLTGLGTGALLLLMARFKADRLARVMPFSVAAGFLAASGWLLVSAALTLAGHVGSVWHLGTALSDPATQRLVFATVAFGLSLLILSRFFGLSAILTLIALGFGLFYGAMSLTGAGLESARQAGDLPQITSQGFAELPDLGLIQHIDWAAVSGAAPLMAAACLVNIVGFFLNVTGVELGARRDIDIGREIAVTGKTNLVAGLVGAPATYLASGVTLLAVRLGLRSRAVGIAVTLMCFGAFFFANTFIPYVPHFLTNGFILFIGLTMLEDWLIKTRTRLEPLEWLVVLSIVLTTAVAGITAAILLGLGLALVKFVVGYARLPVIRRAGSLADWPSSVDRSQLARERLEALGDTVFVVDLRGFIFFGSAEQILDTVRTRMNRSARLEVCVLDFAGVTGLDSTAYAALEKLGQIAQGRGVELVLAGLSPGDTHGLLRWGLDLTDGAPFRSAPSCDAALTAIEDRLAGPESTRAGDPVALFVSDAPTATAQALFDLAERKVLQPSERLIAQGTSDRDVFFVLSGRLSVFITASGGTRVRVRSMLAGTIVGEISRYLGGERTADVIADVPSVVLALRDAEIKRIERDEPELSSLLHRLIARNLAETVSKTNRVLGSMVR